ncbi:MAG: carotenoid oxygenase family protein [Deltaproteobacteria bacterium]|nr:carotenoid oxygenase family protein [Deltaproteobacteria bacterium]
MWTALGSLLRPQPAPSPAPRAEQPTPSWRVGFEDLAREHGFEPLRVEGSLPHELEGTLYRNGPGRFGVGGERYRHWFDGDGAVTAVRVGHGRAFGATKMVQTPAYLEERRAGRRLYGGYDTPLARPFYEVVLGQVKNAGNTSIMLWDDRVFALCESGRPIELADNDLTTLGENDLGVVRRAFAAHPHRVPSRRALYGFGLGVGPRTSVEVYELPDDRAPRTIARFSLDGLRLNHDFAVTERHAVFLFSPTYLSISDMLLFRRGPVSSARWRPERGVEVVLVGLDAPHEVVRFHVDAFHMEHVVNAFERDGEIVIDQVDYPDPWGLERFVSGLVRGVVQAPLASRLRRVVIDPNRRTLRAELLADRPLELPRVSPRVESRPHRFAYLAGASGEFIDAVLAFDLETGAVDRFAPGADQYPSEAVFVPRDGGGEENDGWLLTMVLDARQRESHLAVLDARRVGAGPIARLWFDHAIPFGFHGAWAGGR